MDVNGSVALVTGGASGLGLATTEKLVEAGAKVVIVDLPSSAGEAVADKLGDNVRFAAADVTNTEQITAALDVAAELGELRVAVNCAGIGNQFRTVGRKGPFPLEEFVKVININLVGTFNVLRLAAERMSGERAARRGPRRHREHRLDRGDGRADRAGRLLGVEGRHRRHDAADRP